MSLATVATPYLTQIGKHALSYAAGKAYNYAKRKASDALQQFPGKGRKLYHSAVNTARSMAKAKRPSREIRGATGGHTYQIKTRPINKRYRRRKNYKITWRRISKTVKNIVKYSHGPRTDVEFWQKYHLNTDNSGTATDVVQTGLIECDGDQLGHGFIPLLSDEVMASEFRTGEDAASNPNKFGILDPPPDLNSGGAGAANVNLVKDREVICIDSMLCRLFISNNKDTKIMVWLVEWVCNESSDVNIVKRTVDQYNSQEFFVANGTTPIAANNLFKQPNFLIGKVPNIQKYWKKGKFFKKIELKPGESIEVFIPFSKIYWNQGKFQKEDGANNDEYRYHRNLSRFIQISVRGQVGFVEATPGDDFGTSFFQKGGIQWQMSKKMKAHRIDRFGQEPRRYVVNPVLTTDYEAATGVSEQRPDPAVGALVKSQVLAIQETS